MYTITIYSSPTVFPLSLFRHAWIVTEYDGVQDRFEESWSTTLASERSYGYVHKNQPIPLTKGVTLWFTQAPTASTPRWNGTIDSQVSGEAGSVAHKIYTTLHSEAIAAYPYRNRYNFLLGPNSNAFVDWVIDSFPEAKLKKHPMAVSGIWY